LLLLGFNIIIRKTPFSALRADIKTIGFKAPDFLNNLNCPNIFELQFAKDCAIVDVAM